MENHKQDFTEFIKTQLNPEQQQAVLIHSGPILVIAGAGSGKTRVITARIANLILHEGTIPSSIIALTFTNKAAQEMQHRITNFLGKLPEMPFIGTFHSYCLRFLKTHQEHLTIPFFSILDEDDQQKIITGIIKRNGLSKKVTPKQISYQISLIKNQSINPENTAELQHNQFMYEIYKAYEAEKRASKCYDFDDLLLETVKLLKKNAPLLEHVHATIEHVLVDEYQDTNLVQNDLLKLLTRKDSQELAIKSICVVGDEDQSIYSWRGATVSNILNFKKEFKGTSIIKIEQNYRSVQPILEAANQVIIHNEQRNPKNLWSTREGTDRVLLLACNSEYQEADAVTSFLKTVTKHKTLETAAVLYRAHYQSRSIEEALIKRSIPYTIIGGIQFYDRKEIKDLLAYLRLIVNPYDRASFFRVINCPQRGLGEAFEELFYSNWHTQPFMTFKDVAHKLCSEGTVQGKKAEVLISFVRIFDQLNPSDITSSALDTIIKRTNYITYLKDNFDEQEAETKIENVKELMQGIIHFESLQISTVGLFLDEVALLQEKIQESKKENNQAVVLMTLHAAKGLEFDNVAIVGLNEDLLPSSRSAAEPDGLEEERRLLYVGITRARERLVLSYAHNRHMYGHMAEYMPSRFLREIPSSLFTRHDLGYIYTEQLDEIFSDWLGQTKVTRQPVMPYGTKIRYTASTQPKQNSEQNSSSWKKNQPVVHPQFGVGIVQEIELKKNGKVYITANFKSGTKKIESSFLQPV
jgi:DNA helicase-2/ATP-dependent DNA helicase PcrA